MKRKKESMAMTTRRNTNNGPNSKHDNEGPAIDAVDSSKKIRRLCTRYRVVTFGLMIFTILLFISMISIVVKVESNITTTGDYSILRVPNNSIRIEKKNTSGSSADKTSTTKKIVNSKNIDDKDNTGETVSIRNALVATKTEELMMKKKEGKPLEIDVQFDDPPIFEAPIFDATIVDFDRLNDVVIVSKIQGEPHLRTLRQMLCLLNKAYNNRVLYDIVIFTSEPISNKTAIHELSTIVSPARLIIEIDNPGLQTMVDNLSKDQRDKLLRRCGNITSSSDLSWYTECTEVTSYKTLKGERIAYNWQAEFRALWLWTHPSLKSYKYMMWLDSDVFCTRVWKQDPIAAMKRHDLVLLFDHFPQGAAQGKEFPLLTREVFNRTICDVNLVNGTLVAKDGRCHGKKKSRIKQVHGFFHCTDLDFFRSDAVMKWNRALIGESKFSRLFDDQIGLTIPAAVLAGHRSRDMRSIGIYTRVFHNYVLDGIMKNWRGYFVPWWNENSDTIFPEASEQCFVDISG